MSVTRKLAREESRLEMTPMIDVTFLLLVFFLCTIQFKTLEGKIPAYMPKGVGVNASEATVQLEKIPIHIERDPGAVNTDPEVNPNWIWSQDQIRIRVGPRVVPLGELHQVMNNLARSNPEAKATLYPALGSLYIDTVKVVNECLRGGFVDLTIAGAPPRR